MSRKVVFNIKSIKNRGNICNYNNLTKIKIAEYLPNTNVWPILNSWQKT